MSIVAEAGFGPVAQRLEQWTHNPLVPGSNPGGPTRDIAVLGGSSPARLAIVGSFLAALTPSAETSKPPEPHNVAEGPASGKFTL